jgi:predicted PhzF superfamily epimerase YddE/YHI9
MSPHLRWNWSWLVPVAAALLVAFGVMIYRGQDRQTAKELPVTPVSQASLNPARTEDQLLLEALETHSPAMRATYETNLQNVNAYIHDAEDQASADPNDEEARQSLMNAYQQKAMVYEMALNRSLP